MVTMTDKYGPNTKQVEAFLALLPTLTAEQWVTVRNTYTADAAWYAAWYAAWDAARHAAWNAAWNAAEGAAYSAAWYAARAAAVRAAVALVTRDIISREYFDVLTAPFRAAGVDFDALGVES